MRGTFRQQIVVTFVIASALTAIACDYAWAYHFAPYDLKFPTPLSVFEFSLQISAVFVCLTTILFALPLLAVARYKVATASLADHCIAAILGSIVQPVIFLSPHISDRSNPVLVLLFVAPLLASVLFVLLRQLFDATTSKNLQP